jgi:hypothetical protein
VHREVFARPPAGIVDGASPLMTADAARPASGHTTRRSGRRAVRGRSVALVTVPGLLLIALNRAPVYRRRITIRSRFGGTVPVARDVALGMASSADHDLVLQAEGSRLARAVLRAARVLGRIHRQSTAYLHLVCSGAHPRFGVWRALGRQRPAARTVAANRSDLRTGASVHRSRWLLHGRDPPDTGGLCNFVMRCGGWEAS